MKNNILILSLIALFTAALPAWSETKNADKKDEAPSMEELKKADQKTYNELVKNIYLYDSGNGKPDPKKLQQVETSFEKLLTATVKMSEVEKQNTDLRALKKKYEDETSLLSERYRGALKDVKFNDSTLQFQVQLMCTEFADAYKYVVGGDFNSARTAFKRGKDKKDEIRKGFLKKP